MRNRTAFTLAYTLVGTAAVVGALTLTSHRLPDLTGMGLESAQRIARENGFFDLHSIDGAGLKRSQLWDRSWTVCSQRPQPGQYDPETTPVTLIVVHASEAC